MINFNWIKNIFKRLRQKETTQNFLKTINNVSVQYLLTIVPGNNKLYLVYSALTQDIVGIITVGEGLNVTFIHNKLDTSQVSNFSDFLNHVKQLYPSILFDLLKTEIYHDLLTNNVYVGEIAVTFAMQQQEHEQELTNIDDSLLH